MNRFLLSAAEVILKHETKPADIKCQRGAVVSGALAILPIAEVLQHGD